MIYLDYAATAPLRPEISRRVGELHSEALGNPSSLHRAGRRARMVLEQARERCAEQLGAKVEEIIFCSGATEADNLAILGSIHHADTRQQHLVTSDLEHAAVYETVQRQAQLGRGVTWLRVENRGLIDLEHLEAVLKAGPPSLVSVMAVNNEVGVRQPLPQIADLCRRNGALFHCDAVQDPKAAQDLIRAGLVDLLCLSAHKMGGLHGGLLFVRQGIAINPQIVGGSQEDGRRAGTSELLRADSLALALELSLAEDRQGQRECREILEGTLASISGSTLLGAGVERAEHISSWLFAGLSAEPILIALDMKGVCVSSGSACSSHSVEPSRVVKAMGYSNEEASGLVRFSFGWKSDKTETQTAANLARDVIEHLMNKEKKRR